MTVTTDVTTTGDTVTGRFTLKRPTLSLGEVRKPVFAAVGVADLALEQVKDVPADVTAEARRVQARLAEVPAVVRTLPVRVEIRVTKAQETATDLYAKLALRGERLVTQIRRQPATEAAIAEGKEAVRKAEAAAVAARNSVRAGERAVEDAASKLG